MKLLHFDCYSGISGDMTLAALLGIGGVEVKDLVASALSRLFEGKIELKLIPVNKKQIAALRLEIIHQIPEEERHLHDIIEMINRSSSSPYLLSPKVKSDACQMFELLAKVEADIHGITPEMVHFHEVGSVDSIIDIVGTAYCIEKLNIEKVSFSAINTGQGVVKCIHGILPVPAPATVRLLKGVPIYSNGIKGELATPTGALFAQFYGVIKGGGFTFPSMRPIQDVFGAGTKDIPEQANVLRAVLGESTAAVSEFINDRIYMLETNIDDMNPEIYGHVFDGLFKLGALDVFMIPAIGKKQRPTIILSVICKKEDKDVEILSSFIFNETTTSGIRVSEHLRHTLDREKISVNTKYGPIDVKYMKNNSGKILSVSPEYESCRTAALKHGVALKKVFEEAKISIPKPY